MLLDGPVLLLDHGALLRPTLIWILAVLAVVPSPLVESLVRLMRLLTLDLLLLLHLRVALLPWRDSGRASAYAALSLVRASYCSLAALVVSASTLVVRRKSGLLAVLLRATSACAQGSSHLVHLLMEVKQVLLLLLLENSIGVKRVQQLATEVGLLLLLRLID